jgi:NADP-reducing hydrogenase subunit HndD
MLGALLKRVTKDVWGGHEPEDIFLVSVMPCVRKKGESQKPQYLTSGVRDVDEVITTRDLGALLRSKGINPKFLAPQSFDDPLGHGSGAGQIFGVTGGVMEAAVRTVYAVVTEGEVLPRLELDEVRGFDGLKTVDVSLLSPKTGKGIDKTLRLGVVNGLAEAKKVIQNMRDGSLQFDFVEIMACPGGCIGGGGQPRSKNQKETL